MSSEVVIGFTIATVLILAILLPMAVWLPLVFLTHSGRGWARIAMTMLLILLLIAALVLMFTPASNAYFRARRSAIPAGGSVAP